MNSSPGTVIVGFDGTHAAEQGLHYAVLEARRLGAPLQIVHVTPGYVPTAPSLPIVPDATLRSYGLKLLEGAGITARALAPEVAIDTRLLAGSAVGGLAQCSEDAVLMVLGSDHVSAMERVWTGDVIAGVAAQAKCPVVVVPPEWDASSEVRNRIVVGVKSSAHCSDLLAAGLALAHARKAELVVLHSWKLQFGYDDIVSTRVAADQWGRRETSFIEPVLNELRRDYHEVPVRIEVLHAQAAYALVEASRSADRLVIGRPAHGAVLHHLGAAARAVLRESHCPVEVRPTGVRPADTEVGEELSEQAH